MKKQSGKKCSNSQYPCHSAEVGRINRIIGQVEAVKKMISERRYCPEIITLLRASRSAIKSVEANILETHLESCIADTFELKNKEAKIKKIKELKEIFKRFED